MTHKFIEDFATADIAFEASGKDLNELFKSSAEALFEILYIKDLDFMIFCNCDLKIKESKSGYELDAVVYGEKINPKKHELHSDAKAITLHQFSIDKTKNGYKAFVIVDI